MNVTTLAAGGLVIAAPSPTPSPPPQPNVPACAPTDSTDLAIAAQNIAFDVNCLAVVPDTDFAVAFDNKDVGTPHNFAIYQDAAYTKLLGGATSATDFITGPDTATYQVSGLAAGNYYFRCDLHPTQMTGQFIVAAPSKGAGTTTPAPSPTSS
jgi:plastocyanin